MLEDPTLSVGLYHLAGGEEGSEDAAGCNSGRKQRKAGEKRLGMEGLVAEEDRIVSIRVGEADILYT